MGNTQMKTRGFTLLEMLVSMAIGLVIIAGAVQLYSQAVKATFTTSQKAELQQDFRSASNLMARDISLAGAGAPGQMGLAQGAVALPTGTGTLPVYPCSSTACTYVAGSAVAYPSTTGAPTLYSIIPGYDLGIIVTPAQGPTDIITVTYADTSLELNCYNVTLATVGSTTTATFVLQSPLTAPCQAALPTGVVTPPSLLDPVVGLQKGDMIMFSNLAIGSVSTVAAGGAANTFAVTFTSGDPGHINQPTAASGSLKQMPAGTTTATRMLVITYYLDISPMDGVTPRLMRVQNGRIPSPVAENVAYLKFTYDVYNNGTVLANQSTLPVGSNPSMITKINIAHMTMRSQLQGTAGYQGLDLQTSISARNVTFGQEYPISGTAY